MRNRLVFFVTGLCLGTNLEKGWVGLASILIGVLTAAAVWKVAELLSRPKP